MKGENILKLDTEKCTGCSKCVLVCPTGALEKAPPKVKVVEEKCVNCGVCMNVCELGAWEDERVTGLGRVKCEHCPVECEVPVGQVGACRRYRNVDGELVLDRRVVVREFPSPYRTEYQPLMTGCNAGTNYPDIRPAPYIVQKNIDGVDVVTVVTETPLTYSNMLVKIDTDLDVANEGSRVYRNGCDIGMVETEQYGAKMLSIGGGNIFSGANRLNGCMASKTCMDIANGETVRLRVQNGSGIELRLGEPPVVNGKCAKIMRVGCGSATTGIFARHLKEVVDESIILDHLVTGLLTEHKAGEEVGCTYSGVVPAGNRSTRGRYFGVHGDGWGGTNITDPRDAIVSAPNKPGMTILVTETTGERGALFQINNKGEVERIGMKPEVQRVLDLISANCEKSRVSAMLIGGFGGSARAGVTRNPIRLTEAVHAGKVRVTCGGEPVYILPGGNISLMVDVEKIPPHAISWCATPAPCIAGEYTMTLDTYKEIEGHIHAIRPLEDVLEKENVQYFRGNDTTNRQ